MKKEQHKKISSEAKRLSALVFSETEIAEQKSKLEDLFAEYEATLTDLIESEKAAKDGNDTLVAKIDTLDDEKAALEDQLKAILGDKTQLEEKLTVTESKIVDLEAEVATLENEMKLQIRVKELEDAGVRYKDKVGERQVAKVKTMSDEAFTEYVEDQKALKEQLLETADTSVNADPNTPGDSDVDADDMELAKMSRADLIKVFRASAGLNLPSKKTFDALVSQEYKDKVKSMWDEPDK